MPSFNSTRYVAPAQPVVRPYTGGYDMAEVAPEDLYDVHDDYDDISLYVARAEGYRDE